jgi:uncharacterized membrane protein (UPF0127 family)
MNVKIGDNILPAEYMNTPEQISKGMMGRKTLNGCMVFKMNKGYHSFWMKNCLINLDIIFVLNNRITRIYRNCEPCDIECNKRYNGIGDHVIELPSDNSFDFKINDRVNLYLGSPQNPLQ